MKNNKILTLLTGLLVLLFTSIVFGGCGSTYRSVNCTQGNASYCVCCASGSSEGSCCNDPTFDSLGGTC